MSPKDESIVHAGLLGAVVGLLLNGPRGALMYGLAGATIGTACEYPSESAALLRKVLEPKKLPKARKVQPAVAEGPQSSADVELKECKACGSFHRVSDCSGRAARSRKAHRTRTAGKSRFRR